MQLGRPSETRGRCACPPPELKRLAEHLNAPSEQHKAFRTEMRESERRRRFTKEHPQEDDDDDAADPQGTAYSAIEILRKKDFESFTWDEVQEAKKLMARCAGTWGCVQHAVKGPPGAARILTCGVLCAETLSTGQSCSN